MKVVTILGARPNFIKAFLISQELQKKGHEEIIIHTGQHYDYQMSQIFFKDLSISKPRYNLELRSDQINEMVRQIGAHLAKLKPQAVIVYGDTNSTLAGSIASFLHHIPIAHVEAGIRCFDLEMPEERNRIIIDHYATWLFCPTKSAVINLRREGIKKHVFFTGNVMYDSILYFRDTIDNENLYKQLGYRSKSYCLLTLHRQANVDDKNNLLTILGALSQIKQPIIFPVHPRTEKSLKTFRLYQSFKSRCKLIKPIGYVPMLSLIKNASFVVTDSGGVQTDAYSLETPCITLLMSSAWDETVKSGWNKVVNLDTKKMRDAVSLFSRSKPPKQKNSIFGDGYAYRKIVKILSRYET